MKTLSTAGQGKKDKYLQPCLERRHTFTHIVYSVGKVPGIEAIAALQGLALILSKNPKQEYLEMCSFVRAIISLVVVRSNTLLLRGAKYNEAYIHQRPYLTDGSMMVLLPSWRG